MAVTRNGTVETRTTGIESCLGAGGRAVPDFPVPGDGGGEPSRRNAVSRPMAGPAFASRMTAAIRPTTPRTTIIQLYLLLAPPPPTSSSPSLPPPLPPQIPPLPPHPASTTDEATTVEQYRSANEANNMDRSSIGQAPSPSRFPGKSRCVAPLIATGSLSAFDRRKDSLSQTTDAPGDVSSITSSTMLLQYCRNLVNYT